MHHFSSHINVFFVGAGRPRHGHQPSALKRIAQSTRAIDWQLQSFDACAQHQIKPIFHYLGGYHVEDIIAHYNDLHFTVIPNWETSSILNTILQAPFSGRHAIMTYSDTIFRPQVINQLLTTEADIVFGIDTTWKKRYKELSQIEEEITEKMLAGEDIVKFTGLVYFSQPVTEYLSSIDEKHSPLTHLENLPNLLKHLEKQGFLAKAIDVAGQWAELDFPRDLAHFILGTKAETLARLEPLVHESHIGKQFSFSVQAWQENHNKQIERILTIFSPKKLIVRSSSKDEDRWDGASAGRFESILNIDSTDISAIHNAIEKVIASYYVSENVEKNTEHQILVQEFLENVVLSGVVFTCGLETGSPYYRFNFDDKTSSTESVTSGLTNEHRTLLLSRFHTDALHETEPKLVPVLKAIQELEKLLGFDKLDIEFAIDQAGNIHIFQVRPITVDHSEYETDDEFIIHHLEAATLCFNQQQAPVPWIYGDKAIFSNMSDWNPAEIIGKHPKTLAFSLYRELIMDETWAKQRAEYGFRDIRPSPLLFAFSGQPYVDVRASINSFIPTQLSENTANRLANAYIQCLLDNTSLHDKIEFEVLFTTWTPDFQVLACERLMPYGITQIEINELEDALKKITRHALTRLKDDTASVSQLSSRRTMIISSTLSNIDKAFALLQDCKNFGTLAFAHAARAGFVAITFLKSFVNTKILSEQEKSMFLSSIHTVTGQLNIAKKHYHEGQISLSELIDTYGHLRPETYEIRIPAYWENPEHYLLSGSDETLPPKTVFSWTSTQLSQIQMILTSLNSPLTPEALIEFIEKAIQAREFVKFEFTRNLSAAFNLLISWGKEQAISREQLSWLSY